MLLSVNVDIVHRHQSQKIAENRYLHTEARMLNDIDDTPLTAL